MKRRRFLKMSLAAAVSPLTMTAARAQGLSASEVSALGEAIQDEYKARATYAKVIETFGNVPPFANIIRGENQHIASLSRLFEAYGVPIPKDTWATRAPVFESLEAACAAGVQAELENGALYDRLLAQVTHPGIARVFESLQRASLESHLAAFQACASGTGRGGGTGVNARGHGPANGSGRNGAQSQGGVMRGSGSGGASGKGPGGGAGRAGAGGRGAGGPRNGGGARGGGNGRRRGGR